MRRRRRLFSVLRASKIMKRERERGWANNFRTAGIPISRHASNYRRSLAKMASHSIMMGQGERVAKIVAKRGTPNERDTWSLYGIASTNPRISQKTMTTRPRLSPTQSLHSHNEFTYPRCCCLLMADIPSFWENYNQRVLSRILAGHGVLILEPSPLS
ncbi:hypothetical protein CDAR_320481 [Caerostris darwini]|uniref:Uncharacterized protein n=1 Tax=Caerostris darwini TaxID=1538125 RepID=A0AAV4WYI2_9ARAC|nr:hypothetical protein CDAR_320481 [Caerostris darwini]